MVTVVHTGSPATTPRCSAAVLHASALCPAVLTVSRLAVADAGMANVLCEDKCWI